MLGVKRKTYDELLLQKIDFIVCVLSFFYYNTIFLALWENTFSLKMGDLKHALSFERADFTLSFHFCERSFLKKTKL